MNTLSDIVWDEENYGFESIAYLNNCKAEIRQDDFALYADLRDDPVGTLVVWDHEWSHLSDKEIDEPNYFTGLQGTEEYEENGGLFDGMDLSEALRQLEEDYEAIVIPVKIEDYRYEARIREATRDEANGAIWLRKGEIEYYGGKDEARKYLEGQILEIDYVLRGDVWVVYLYDHKGEHVDSIGGIFVLDYAQEEAAGLLLWQDKNCQRCDGKGNTLGVPCQECLGSGDTHKAEALLA